MDEHLSKFFLVVPPGFEAIAREELKLKHPLIAGAKPVYGGVELETTFFEGCALNHTLKIPTKILLRLAEFKCRDFPKLFNKLKKLSIHDYISDSNFSFEVSCQKSRLLNEKRVLKVATEALKPLTHEKSYHHSIYIRFYDDVCTVSLDTSGELLFKRGYKTNINKAPLRENLAAAIILKLCQKLDLKTYSLVDPMCGSGTFLLEAENFFKPTTRLFAYQKFKGTHKRPLPTPLKESFQLKNVYGFDIESIEIAKQNWKQLPSPTTKAIFDNHDVFVENKQNFSKPLVLVCNPPYGKLLKLPLPPQEYFSQLLHALSLFDADVLGCVIPKKNMNIKKIDRYKQSDATEFSNGGIPVAFCLYERQS